MKGMNMAWAAAMLFGLSILAYDGNIGAGYGTSVGVGTDVRSGTWGDYK